MVVVEVIAVTVAAVTVITVVAVTFITYVVVACYNGEDLLVSNTYDIAEALDTTMVDECTCLDVPNNKGM